jgi:drug/metabolite transporter (DMT)-like permease
VLLALGAVYVIWGSTYFAMRVAMTYLPPFIMGGARFSAAGLALYAFLRLRGMPAPGFKEWASAALVGGLLLVLGNGFVALSERTIDSGIAALVVATVPLWTAAIAALFGERPTVLELGGLLLGFLGILVLRSGSAASFRGWDALLLCCAPLAWALGSVLSRHLPLPRGLMATATEMVAAGAGLFVIALVRGDRPLGAPTLSAVVALAYLVVFGSLVAFSAFGFLLRTTRPALAMSYAYVNPMVALGIGTVFGGELFSNTKVLACTLTVAGVVMASLGRGEETAKPAA